MKRPLFFSLIAALLLGSAAPPSPTSGKPSKGPALWVLADSDTQIHIFGTIHLLPVNSKWRTPLFNQAVANAQTLMLEVGNLDDQAAMLRALHKYALLPAEFPVLQRVPPSKRDALARLIKSAKMSEAMLAPYEDWAVATFLSVGVLGSVGLSKDESPETRLREEFRRAGKPVQGLETAEQTFAALDSLSKNAQLIFLNSVIDESESVDDEFAEMYQAWLKGDEGWIARTFDDDIRAIPELLEKLAYRRNASWTRRIAQRMAQPGKVFVAVGAGHLSGKGSLIAMLRKRGYKVKRIQ
jgi:uncharacterized protein